MEEDRKMWHRKKGKKAIQFYFLKKTSEVNTEVLSFFYLSGGYLVVHYISLILEYEGNLF